MKRVICYGDSNTWGLVPGTNPHERFPKNERWTGILQEKCAGAEIIEEGLCGRTTIFEDALRPGRNGLALLPVILESHQPLDAVILMLGTNDCKKAYGANEYIIGKGIERCIDEIEKVVSAGKILLISPVFLGEDVWKPEKDPEFDPKSVEVSRGLKAICEEIASRRGTAFLAASDYVTVNDADCEHLDANGHAILADAVADMLETLW